MSLRNSIFVTIASYRDSELVATIGSLLRNASNTKLIRISVCQQDEPENFVHLNIPNVIINHFHYSESLGVGWARREANRHYNGEGLFLQIDSHIEMVKNWDILMFEQYELAKQKSDRESIFAAYPVAYHFNEGSRKLDPGRTHKTKVKFIPDTKILEGEMFDLSSDLPIKARYLNAGFMFGCGKFMEIYPGDPDIYFWGEEFLNSIVAYTNGYDLFHPSLHMCWHHYTRVAAPHHWSAEDEKRRKIKSDERDKLSRQKVNNIVTGEVSNYLGNVRTLKDFEVYAGVDFESQKITDEAKSGNYVDE